MRTRLKGVELGEGVKTVGGSFLKGYTFPFCIKCFATTLSTVLMKKWPMNSIFTASNPFYHIQQSPDETSILRKALRHTSRRLGSKEGGYIRGRSLPMKEGSFGGKEREKQETEQCIAMYKFVSIIYKNSTSRLTKESFILNNSVICFPLLGLLDLSPKLNPELY